MLSLKILFSILKLQLVRYLSTIKAIKQKCRDKATIIAVDSSYFRPTEVDLLIGDPTKSMTKLGWKPEYDLKGLVKDMMQSDVKLMKKVKN